VNRLTLLSLLALTGCISTHQALLDLDHAERTSAQAMDKYGAACAAVPLARAQVEAELARKAFSQTRIRDGVDHAANAKSSADTAWAITEPCASQDADGDQLPDVVDICPNEPEDYDGDRDNDGCRDIDPAGDVDGDGVRNIDDMCLDTPEDLDGHNDFDGCPETSADTDGDGIIDISDTCPDEAEDKDQFNDEDGCPDPDNDGAGIMDMQANCPNSAEDLDDWDDEDGCPDPDNDLDGIGDKEDACPYAFGPRNTNGCPNEDMDSDGIADQLDQCPEQPETYNGTLDDDGCPDTVSGKVKVGRTRVVLEEPIRFETGTARLDANAIVLLDDVVEALQGAPTLRIRIEGHTDTSGTDAQNQKLSVDRAEAVRAYLEDHGIDADRMESVGYGSDRPVDTNRTSTGRAKNRRIEIHVID